MAAASRSSQTTTDGTTDPDQARTVWQQRYGARADTGEVAGVARNSSASRRTAGEGWRLVSRPLDGCRYNAWKNGVACARHTQRSGITLARASSCTAV